MSVLWRRRVVLGWAAIGAWAVVAGVLGCGQDASAVGDPKGDEPLKVVVGVPPLVGIVRAIVPGAQVRSLVPPGQSVHGYELQPSDVRALAEAHLLVGVGLGIDPGLERYIRERARPGQRVVEFARVVGVEASHDHDHAHHEGDGHDHGHAHNHGAADPHLWLDPGLVLRLGEEVKGQAVAAMPGERSAAVEAAHAVFVDRVKEVDAAYTAGLAPLRGRAIVTHHDSFGRVAERYGLRVAAVIREIEASEATPGAIAAAVDAIRSQDARAVFFEPAYDQASAERIAKAAGVRLGKLDPESSEDWFGLMRANLDSLVENLGDGGGDEKTKSGAEPR